MVISASKNSSCEKRTGTFTISTTDLTPAITVTVTVEQNYKPRTLTVDKELLLIEGKANNSTCVKIASNMSWNISKPSDCNWLTINPATGSNNETVAATTTSRNTSGAELTANVVIVPECASVANKTITITQSI